MSLAGVTTTALDVQAYRVGGNYAHVSVTMSAGQSWSNYTVVGRVTATGEVKVSKADATDGSQLPIGIVEHQGDTTTGAFATPMLVGGEFDATMVVWDSSWTAVAKAGAFDRTPIVLKTPR